MDTQLEPRQEQKRRFSIGRRQVVITCAVLLIAAAVVLNLVLFDKNTLGGEPDAEPSGNEGEVQDAPTTTADGYFSATQVSRQRARDEALEVLQSVVDSEDADESTKAGALLEISELARDMEAEANIETLVCGKGFAQCVAVINGDNCSVVVKCEGELLPAQISQINEIVYEQAGIAPTNVRIITK